MKKIVLLLISVYLCAVDYEALMKANSDRYSRIIEANTKKYDNLIKANHEKYSKLIANRWGRKNVKLSTKKAFTQYSKNLKQRETIDYEKGKVTIEILSKNIPTPKEFNINYKKLRNQTINENTKHDPLFKEIKTTKINKQKLNKKVMQQKTFKKDDIKKKPTSNGFIYFVEESLIKGYIKKSASIYMKEVLYYSKLYNIKPSYILAIIETESSFNPNATSDVPAYGLMQIVPNTAGKDVNKYLTGKSYKPTEDELKDYKINIKMGTTYIKIIQSRYLKGITNQENLYLCTSTSYNAGIGNLYKSFGRKTRSDTVQKINSLESEEIYKHLHNHHSLSDEAKRYVKKVKNYMEKWETSLKI